MKALVVHVPYEHRGGEDVHVETLLQAYASIGVEAELYPTDRTPPGLNPLVALRSLFPLRLNEDWKATRKRFEPDFVHLHNIFPSLGPQFLAELSADQLPVIQTVHNHRFFCTNGLALRNGKICKECFDSPSLSRPVVNNCNEDPRKSAYYSFALAEIRGLGLWKRAVRKWIAPSPYIHDELVRFGIDAKNIHQIVNPIVAPPPLSLDLEYDFIYAGRLSAEKGIGSLLAAARLLPNRTFVILGDGPLRAEVEQTCSRIKNIQYLGQKPTQQLFEILARSRVGVLPSICNEILPTFVLESFVAGKRCVIPDLPSTQWLAEEPWGGQLSQTFDPANLAAILEETWSRGPLPSGKTSQIIQRLSIDRFCSELKELVHEIT